MFLERPTGVVGFWVLEGCGQVDGHNIRRERANVVNRGQENVNATRKWKCANRRECGNWVRIIRYRQVALLAVFIHQKNGVQLVSVRPGLRVSTTEEP